MPPRWSEPSRFERDTAAVPAGDGRYHLRVDEGWHVFRGPNGGYLAALAARALCTEVAGQGTTGPAGPEDGTAGTAGQEDTAGPAGQENTAGPSLRSLAVHYLRPPAVGAMAAEVGIEHTGRAVTMASAVLRQGGEPRLLARAVFTRPDPGIALGEPAPVVPPPERLASSTASVPPGIRDRFEWRWAIGAPPPSGAAQALVGGWVRLSPAEAGTGPGLLDGPLLAAYADCWYPAIYRAATEQLRMYTTDLTVHVAAPVPAAYDDWVLVRFSCDWAADGLAVEDGRIWTRDGRLVAMSRQLAVVRPVRTVG